MNFFEHQGAARNRTSWLLVLFSLAVLLLVVSACLLVMFLLLVGDVQHNSQATFTLERFATMADSQLLLPVALGIVLVIAVGSVFKMLQLSSGGAAVAEQLGGRQLNVSSASLEEKQLLNVVEEIAIASGMPVPSVYLLPEQGINAFAAGTRTNNAVIGITEGALKSLNREELQGVVAHEFSHIFNGDMRLNIRLMGVLNGILIFGIAGYYLMRIASRGGVRSEKNGAIPFVLLGVGLMIIGYGGTLFGNLIKSAVSRQREYLADASAVQFTRNPSGIGNALKKIGGFQAGGLLENTAAREASHLFFAQAIQFYLNGMFATHPPLSSRIQRLDADWQHLPVQQSAVIDRTAANGGQGTAALAPLSELGASAISTPQSFDALSNSFERIGEIEPESLQAVERFLADLPDDITESLHESYGAKAVVIALLVDRNPEIRAKQWRLLRANVDRQTRREINRFRGWFDQHPERQLIVLDIALPAIAQFSDSQRAGFKYLLSQLIHADGRIELFEWSLYVLVMQAMNTTDHAWPVQNGRGRNLRSMGAQMATVLSVVSYAGIYESYYQEVEPRSVAKDQSVLKAFDAAKQVLGMGRLSLRDRNEISIKEFSRALKRIDAMNPLQKPRFLKALVAAIQHDDLVKPLEIQLLKAIAQSIDCPMPLAV